MERGKGWEWASHPFSCVLESHTRKGRVPWRKMERVEKGSEWAWPIFGLTLSGCQCCQGWREGDATLDVSPSVSPSLNRDRTLIMQPHFSYGFVFGRFLLRKTRSWYLDTTIKMASEHNGSRREQSLGIALLLDYSAPPLPLFPRLAKSR